MEKYIKKNNIGDKIKLFGIQSNPFNLVKQADALICASLEESYNTSCVEACLLEVPVLTVDVYGAHDIINTAKAGMVIHNADNEIHDSVKYLLDNPNVLLDWKNTLKTTKTNFYKEKRKEALKILIKEIESLPIRKK